MQAVQVGEEHRPAGLGEVFVVLDRRLHRVALEQNAALEIAEAIARRTRGMAYRRRRLEQHTPAADPGPPAEVDILEIGKEIVVERAELEKRGTARDHVPAAGE